ncbi:hypothetical protein CMU70_18555 [Elizabethkingia anophelis]|nr:hypothetical protein [Elizabethkingia anophelis]MDV3837654.1 hypothetical protein [Elizabethkingia anophelis]
MELQTKYLFDIESDVLIIPITTTGLISHKYQDSLNKLASLTEQLSFTNKHFKLGEVRFLGIYNHKYIIAVCTIGEFAIDYYVIRLIANRVAKELKNIENISTIATPILGTEMGDLDPALCLNIMNNAFFENENTTFYKLIFSIQNFDLASSLQNLRLDSEVLSGQLVIKAELKKILIHPHIERLLFDKKFYFHLATEKYKEFYTYEASEEFYRNLHAKFKASELAFKDFIHSDFLSQDELYFTILCGELIAYIDYHAYNKNIWNKNEDKRVLANSMVRQHIWFTNLLKFKRRHRINDITSTSIINAFYYLSIPEASLTMLSENHREKVLTNLLPEISDTKELPKKLINLFLDLGLKARNGKNFSALCSRILYLPFIKPLWDDSPSKEEFWEEDIREIELTVILALVGSCIQTRSTILDLGNCGITDLRKVPEIFECTHIETLILSNEWAEYEGGKWEKKKSKNTGRPNSINFLPKEMSYFTNLKKLICGGDWRKKDAEHWNRWQISYLNTITSLEKLEYLNLSNNNLESLIGLKKFKNLRHVHLNNNFISKTEPLDDLIHLSELNLSNNKIEDVSFLKNLKNIKTLDLHHNNIKKLYPIISIIERIGIKETKWEIDTLNIAQNPLVEPAMTFVELGTQSVVSILRDIELYGGYVNKDLKVILIGNSEVGKSTLLKYLNSGIDLDKNHHPTLWMDEKSIVSKYSISSIGKTCLLHVFDFGGHDYYHDTHHIFFGSNTIYLLLWDQKTNHFNERKTLQVNHHGKSVEIETQDYPLKYWLDSVKYISKNIEAENFAFESENDGSYNSQLLLIQNKVSSPSDIVFLDNKALREQYPFIFDIINLSILEKRNLSHFDNLFTEALNNMEIIGTSLPSFYKPIKEKIGSYSGPPILTMEEFMEFCKRVSRDESINEEKCRILARYLNSVGIILYINKNAQEKVYINKSWIIEKMHLILESLNNKRGEFDKDYALAVLDPDTGNLDDILNMMQEFKIIFKHPFEDIFIAPLYLPKLPEDKVKLFLNDAQIPYRRFEFNGFIHKNLILKIFEKVSSEFVPAIDKNIFYYWKNGLISKSPLTDEIIMIKFNLGSKEGGAYVDLYNLTPQKKPIFINEVLFYIRELVSEYELEEMITLNGKDYVSKAVLEKNAQIGKHIFTEQKMTDFTKIKSEEKYFNTKDYMEFIENPIKKKKVVISYSKKDVAHVHTLIRYLRPLIDEELIEMPWYCTLLHPADEWNTKIKKHFDEADIIFFMVSEYFYSTKYIIDHEITTAINRYDNKENIKIVPIILEFYDWRRKDPYNLQRFSALPYQAKPISDFKNPKMAWSTVTSSLRAMIEKDLDPGKIDLISRDLEEIYERQVKGKLDNNSDY